MNPQDFAVRIRNLILNPEAIWNAIDGPADHPEAKAFIGTIAHWQLLVVGAPPDENGRMAVGGTAANLQSGEMFVLPLDLAKLAYDRAVACK